jgi:Tol biopolymer transport system component
MGTRLPLRLLYTMVVILAVLTTLFLILTMVLKISDLLVLSSQTTKIPWPKTDPETNVGQNDGYWLGPTYSPDGKRIAFIKGWDDWQIYTIAPDGTNARQVTHDTGGYEIQSWSPNGEQILYENLSDGHRDLFVINADGTGKQRLTSVRSSAEDLNRIHNVLWLP